MVRSACSGLRVDVTIHRIALGKSESPRNAKLRPALLIIALESNVASDMPRLSWACSLRLYSSTLLPATHICAARSALCNAIDTPSPVKEGITAA